MMKNYFVFLLAMLLSVSMTAQKASINTNFLKQTPTKVVELSTKRGITSTSRSNSSTQLIYDERESLNQYDFIKIIHDKSDIGKYKYRVEVTSISGDADLSLVGNNPVQQHSRIIAESDNGPSSKDILEYIAWDLTHEEIAMEIVVTAYTTTTFRVKVYRIDEQLRPCNQQTTIEDLKQEICIGFCISGIIFHAEYFGRPVLLVRQECLSYNSSYINETLYSCEGDQIIPDEAYLDIKSKIHECPNQSQECDDESVIREIKAGMCGDFCEEEKLYHATYYGDPVLYLIRSCPNWPDLPTRIVYNCHGQIIASQGFWSNDLNDNRLEVQSLIHSCEKHAGGGHDACEVTITFKNTGCRSIDVYWDNNGDLRYYTTLRAGDSWRVNTFKGHKWVFKVNGSTIHRWTVNTCNDRTYNIDSEGCGGHDNNNDCPWGDDFETYSTGASVSYDELGGNSEKWHKWSSNSPSGIVTPEKTLEFWRAEYGLQDVVFQLGIQSTNIYKISWQMYIESNSVAYFNVQHTNNSNHFIDGGKFRRTFGSDLSQYQNRWFNVELYVDLDRNKLKLIVDGGRYVAEEDYTSTLGGINFYAKPNAHFYIDNICMREVSRIPLTSQEDKSSSRSSTNDLDILTLNSTSAKKVDTNFDSFKVFPNPSHGMATIQFEQDNEEDLSIEVFNQTGQLVKQLSAGNQSYINQSIDLSDLPNGMYMVKLRGATTNLAQKVLLQQ